MPDFATGVVVGKFYPPHAGHHHLIRAALARCSRVDVLVCHAPDQKIPGELRARWIREENPEARVWVVEDTLGDDTLAWARFTVDFLGRVPDAVFTSEGYGELYAGAMGCRHVSVDPDRELYPVSGTAVRARPADNLRFLSGSTRAAFVPRICLVGAESTGKSTLAAALAETLSVPLVPEYGREYAARKLGAAPFAESGGGTQEWRSGEFLHIAEEHARREDVLAATADPVLVVDTDAFTTGLWHERYLNRPSSAVAALAEQRKSLYALYLLCGDEIPWEQDGTRDGKHIRTSMQTMFRERLISTGRRWVEVGGSPEQRAEAALAAVGAAVADWNPFDLRA